MKNDITEEQSNAILKILDKALANGPWDSSNFLRVIGKKLQQIRDNFAREVQLAKEAQIKTNSKLTGSSVPSGQQEVFVSLYTTDGGVLQSWERIIANLPRQIISRPVYANEADVNQLINSKINKVNEAYVSILINKSDVLTISADKIPTDRLGKPLMILKDKAIDVANVGRFVHVSGTYALVKGRLVKKSVTED